MHRLRTSLVAALLIGLQACATPPHIPAHNNIAARIYTDLARHYWQQGYVDLATDRAQLALQQAPDYPPALDILQQIHGDID